MKKLVLVLLSVAFVVWLAVLVQVGVAGEQTPASAPPEDPLFPQDISAWTYTPEFAERFKRLKLKEQGPTGAFAVNFQVQQVDELDRCVFNVFLDNTLPIDYPEGPVGFLSFTYPMSWAFLKLSPEDQQAVDAGYLAKYRETRAVLSHQAGEDTLTLFQYRTNLYQGVGVVTLAISCDRVAPLQNPLRLKLRMTGGQFHEIRLPDHFREWVHATLKKWRRPEAKVTAEGLTGHNVWSYTPEFAKRFGLPPLNEPAPTGAQAIAFRVERNHRNEDNCMLDVYLDDTVPLSYPEVKKGLAGPSPGLNHYFLGTKEKVDRQYHQNWIGAYSVYANTELFSIWELRTEQEQKTIRFKQHLSGDTFRVGHTSPLPFQQYRNHALPGLSYVAFSIGCMTPPSPLKGPIGVAIAKTDGTKYEIMFPTQFMQRLYQDWKTQHHLPFKRRFPRLYSGEQGTSKK